jgi:hypothetical protein
MLIPIRRTVHDGMSERISRMFAHAASVTDKLRPAQAFKTRRRIILDNRSCRRLAGFSLGEMWD